MGTPYIAPLRCSQCGMQITKSPRAKTPKYCASCRVKQQDEWRKKARKARS